MKVLEIARMIKKEHYPDFYKRLIDLIGLERTLQLAYEFEGETLYIQKLDVVARAIRNKEIRNEFTGGNYKELAKKYNLCESYIREIISNK